MKDMKRAIRRRNKKVKFEARLKKWASTSYTWDPGRKQEMIADARSGRGWTFLRSIGKPCSCWMCSPKYERPAKHQVQKEIWDDIENESYL